MMKCDDREVAMRLGQLEPCEHDALRRIGGESLIRREIQFQRGVSRNWACPGIGRVTSMGINITINLERRVGCGISESGRILQAHEVHRSVLKICWLSSDEFNHGPEDPLCRVPLTLVAKLVHFSGTPREISTLKVMACSLPLLAACALEF
jgi:hypothetical protein